jgi:pre-rRNA-processing protein TSR2
MWMASVIVDAFEEVDPKPDVSYVELTLLQIMEDEFETVLEDGSAEAVAKDIVRMWEEVTSGQDALVKGFEEQAEKIKGKRVEVEVEQGDEEGEWSDADEGDEGEDSEEGNEVPMLVDSQLKPKPEPEVDEDGFTMVKGKGKSHR